MYKAPNGDEFTSKSDYLKWDARVRRDQQAAIPHIKAYTYHKERHKKIKLCPKGCGRTDIMTRNHRGEEMCSICYWNSL